MGTRVLDHIFGEGEVIELGGHVLVKYDSDSHATAHGVEPMCGIVGCGALQS